MKKLWEFLIFCAVLFAGAACGEAAFVPSRGASPNAGRIITAEAAKSLPDDSKVVLQGSIESHIRKDYYVFRDGTGSVTVEIDDDIWRGLIVSPEDTVRVHGEVDRDFGSMKIEVDYIEIVKTP